MKLRINLNIKTMKEKKKHKVLKGTYILIILFFFLIISLFLGEASGLQLFNTQQVNKQQGQNPETILITEALHLDKNKNIIADVYEEAKEKDNNWISVTDSQHIRVTFEKPLTSKNDITLYARPNGDGENKIEVYLPGNETPSYVFPEITEEKEYKIFLYNLAQESDTFDLKITGDIDIDHIVDPSDILYSEDENAFNGANYATGLAIETLSSNTFVITYLDNGNSNYATAIIGTASGSGTSATISYGTEYVFHTAAVNYMDIAVLSSTSFAVAYSKSADNYQGIVKVCSVSGTTISCGGENQFNTDGAGRVRGVTTDALSSTKIVVAYQDYSYWNFGESAIGTVSGTTVTFGTEAAFHDTAGEYTNMSAVKVKALTSTSFVVASTFDVTNKRGRAIVGTVSDTTISYGSPYLYNTGKTSYISLTDTSSTGFVVAWRDESYSDYGCVMPCTVSGTTITCGYESVFNEDTTTQTGIAALSSSKVAISYVDNGSSSAGTAIIGTIQENGTITFSNEYQFNSTLSAYTPITALSNNQVAIAYRDYSTVGGKAVIGTVANSIPAFSAGPSDGSSSSSTPTNLGSNVTFTGTATDGDSDNYYMAICKTSSITAANNAAPTCGGGNWCMSSSTSSGSEASCTYTTVEETETKEWYAFICDHNSSSVCSSVSQGSGDSGSPFKINHGPSFGGASHSPNLTKVGTEITFASTGDDDDTDGSADTVTLYVCKADDFSGGSCGAGGQWCNSTASASNPSCTYTVLGGDSAGAHNYYSHMVDNHGFEYEHGSKDSNFTVDLSPPGVSTLSPADGATRVNVNAELIITFDEEMNVGTGNILIKSGETTVETIDVTSGWVVGTGTTIITIDPPSDLSYGTQYYVQIATTAFDDLAGNSYAGITDTTTWNFTTNALPIPGHTSNNVLGTVTQDTDGTGNVNIPFRVKDADTDNTTTKEWQYSDDGGTTWNDLIAGDMTGEDGAKSSATDWSGTEHTIVWNSQNQIDDTDQDDIQFAFKVNDGTVDSTARATSISFSVDNLDPSVSTYSPADNATGVTTTANLILTFDEAVDVESGNLVIYKTSDNSVVETIDITGATVTGTGSTSITINPSSDLAYETEYYVKIATTALDDDTGNSYAGITDTTTWSFTIEDTPVCPTITNAATYNAYPTCGVLTCNNRYTLFDGSCVVSGGGGIVLPPAPIMGTGQVDFFIGMYKTQNVGNIDSTGTNIATYINSPAIFETTVSNYNNHITKKDSVEIIAFDLFYNILTIQVTSEPQVFALELGEAVEIDLDLDGTKDVYVKFEDVVINRAELTIISLLNETNDTNDTENALYEGKLIKYVDSPKVYLIENNLKRWIVNEEIFNYFNYNWADILTIDHTVIFVDGENIIKSETEKTSPAYIFTRNLYFGLSGEDVKELQKYLNNNGYILAENGYGSLGQETIFFGRLTKTALIKFQKANNITPMIGYFGPITRGVIEE